MEKFKTQDINLAAFLLTKGFKVVSTEIRNRIIEFNFEPSASKVNTVWQFNPDEEISLLQEFLKNKEKVLSFIKEKTIYQQ